MLYVNSLVGKPVISADGKTLGKVREVVCSIGEELISGVVYKKGLSMQNAFVPLDEIEQITQYGVVAKTSKHRTSGSMKNDTEFAGSFAWQAVDETGGSGFVCGFYIDENTGRIIGPEISRGFFEDLSQGRMLAKKYISCAEEGEMIIHNMQKIERSELS